MRSQDAAAVDDGAIGFPTGLSCTGRLDCVWSCDLTAGSGPHIECRIICIMSNIVRGQIGLPGAPRRPTIDRDIRQLSWTTPRAGAGPGYGTQGSNSRHPHRRGSRRGRSEASTHSTNATSRCGTVDLADRDGPTLRAAMTASGAPDATGRDHGVRHRSPTCARCATSAAAGAHPALSHPADAFQNLTRAHPRRGRRWGAAAGLSGT